MRAIRSILLLALLIVVGVLAYNAWSGNGWTLQPSRGTGGIDAEGARQRSVEIAKDATQRANEAATKLQGAVSEGALTAKIKSKMALDDRVKARTIHVETSGSVVTLTGVVESNTERERAVRLASETDGVTRVIDMLEVKKS